MKKLLTLMLLVIMFSVSPAQYFELSFEDTVGQINPQNHSLLLAGHLKNISNDTLDFKMIRLENNLPAPSPAWSSAICLGLCVAPSVDTISTRDIGLSLNPGDSILTEVVFAQTDTVPGVATVKIKYATLDESQIEIQWFEAHTLLNSIQNKPNNVANKFKLLNNYPNPFNNQTIISAQVDKSANVFLQVFDVLGRKVFDAVNQTASTGKVTFRWNGINNNGDELSSGVYFYRVSTKSNATINQSQIKKLTLLR